MYAEMLTLPPRATDGNNKPVANARWYFYAAGTAVAQPAYADPALAEEHPNPLVCDNAGLCAPVYFDPMQSYRAVLRTPDGRTVLADIDPVNANLGAAPFGSAPTYREDAAGAIDRSIADKLRDAPVDVADFGVLDRTGGTDMTEIFTAAYAAAGAAGRALRLPAGRFAVSGLVWDKNVEVFGQGAGQTIFIPTGDDQLVLSIQGDREPADRTAKQVIRDFGIHLDGRVRCLGLCTAYLTRTTLQRIAIRSSDDDFFHDDAGYDRWEAIDNTGWLSLADQYCNFEEIHIERVRLGFVLRPEASAGGGVNNIFSGLHICYVQVGAMMFDDVGFGVGFNFFDNFKLQVCTHCALFTRNINPTTMTGVPIEYSGYQRASISLQGQTVKGCAMQLNHSEIRFEGISLPNWQLGFPDVASPALAYPTIVENASHVRFDNCSAVGLLDVDASSTCDFDGVYSNGGQLVGSRLNLQARGGYAIFSASTPLDYCVDPSLRNDAPFPMTPITMQSADVIKTVNGDATFGAVTRVAFSAAASTAPSASTSTNAVGLQIAPTSFTAGDQAVVSIPVMAQTDTAITCFPVGMGSWTFTLKAGIWQRLFFTNCFDVESGGWMTVGPVGSDAPVLTFGPLMAIKNATATQLRQLSNGHRLNPNDVQGTVLRATAPPTAGTWHAGAMVYNSNLAGTVLAWRCTAAGTPGTWEAITKIIRKNAPVAPGNGFTLPGDASDMQVRISDTNAVIQGKLNLTVKGPIGYGTTLAVLPAGFRPLTYLRPVMVGINDGGTAWEALPAQLDPSTGNLMLLKTTSFAATNVNISAAFAVAAPT